MERLGDDGFPITLFGNNQKTIFITIFNEKLNFLVTVEERGSIIQYDLNPGRSNLRILKEYKDFEKFHFNVGLDFGFLLALGGEDSKVRFVDLRKRCALKEVIKTSVKFIYTMEFCRMDINKVYLCVSGQYYDYSKEKTDIFDVSELIKSVS